MHAFLRPRRRRGPAPACPAGAAAGSREPISSLPRRRRRGIAAGLAATVALAGTATLAAPAGATVLFDGAFATKGTWAYMDAIHRERISTVSDPILGSKRKVLKFTVYDFDTGPTANPRAQLTPKRFWNNGKDYYVGVSYLLPSNWPDVKQGGWVNLGEVYGPPYEGAGPNKFMIKKSWDHGRQVFYWERNKSYNTDHPMELPLMRGRWLDFVFHIKLSTSSTSGYWEAWQNAGSGWQRIKIRGVDRYYSRTMDSSNNGGANYHKISLYRSKGMWSVATMYVGWHRIATSFSEAAPHTYG